MSRLRFARRFRRVGFSLLVIGAFVAGSTLGPATVGAAQSVSAVITNTIANPVPVTVQGRPSVDIGSTGSVSVTNTSANPVLVHEQGTASVNITNSTSQAVPVIPQAKTAILASDNSVSNGPSHVANLFTSVDVSAYRTVRLNIWFPACTSVPSTQTAQVVADGVNILSNEPLTGCTVSYIWDAPGTSLSGSLFNGDTSSVTFDWSLVGRP